MLSANFARWSGLASALGSLLMVSSIAGASALADKEYPYTTSLGEVVMLLLFYLSMLLLLVGLLGYNASRQVGIGPLGRTGIVVASLGVLLVLASPLGYLLETLGWYGKDDEVTWSTMMLGLIITIIGMTVYAAAGLRNGTLPRWAALITAIGGLGTIAGFLTSIFGFDQIIGPTGQAVGAATFAFGVLFAVGWAWMGLSLWSARPETTQPGPATT